MSGLLNLGFSHKLTRDRIGHRITNLFFDGPLVRRSLAQTTASAMSRFGYFVMRDARQSLRRPRQKKLSEMSPAEVLRFRTLQAIAKREGRPAPKRPWAPSRPGEPPRNRQGLLRDFIYFTYDPGRRSVVIGPAILAGGSGNPPVPAILEYGGWTLNRRIGKRVYIEPRPYMRPAFYRQLNKQMSRLWQAGLRPVRQE